MSDKVLATMTREEAQALTSTAPYEWGDPCTSPVALAYQREHAVPAPSWHMTEGALETPWAGYPLFVNPPFGKVMDRWVERCADHPWPVILLTPASNEVGWWQDAYSKAQGVMFLRGRVNFLDQDLVPRRGNTKGTTLFLFHYDCRDLIGLATAGLMAAAHMQIYALRHGHTWQDLRRGQMMSLNERDADDLWAGELAASQERVAYLEALLAAQVREAAHWRQVAREATEQLCAVREAVLYGGAP